MQIIYPCFALKRFNLHATFIFVLLFSLLGQNQTLKAVPAYPHPVEFEQADGSLITILLKGDEKVNWAETPDGYTILVTGEGFYEYAVKDEKGDLTFSGVRVSDVEKRSPREQELLKDLPKGLFYSERQVEMKKAVWEMRSDELSRSFPSTGERTLICILMDYQDLAFSKTQQEFHDLFNQINYTVDGATGSVKDYYLENSYGLFDLAVDVVGPYTAQYNMAHYGSTWAGARELATEAVHLANPDVDYSDYDNSGDGWVDGVYMIFAGYGEEAGGGPNTIWSHAWSIDPVQLDGVWISRYACSPELRGNSGNNITRIGVIGHEFGHILGAPDFYDTDGSGSGGQFTGTGSWDMMAGGTWNNGGATPAHHNAYTKTYLYHWATPTLLNQPAHITMNNAVEYYDSFYRINTNTPGEYYILENRHQIGFDAAIPGQGLIVYHVHKEVASSGNQINVGHPQKMYPVCAGANTDPNSNPSSYGNISSPMTPFPGTTNQTSFTDNTLPSMLSWAGENTHKPLTNIFRNHSEQTVSFDFMEGTDILTDWMHWDDGINSGSVGVGSGGVYQIATRFTPEDLEAFHGFMIHSVRVFMNDVPTEAAIKVWQGSEQDSLQEVAHQSFTPQTDSWIEVELDNPVLIDPALELWFGAEYDDPGAGVFTAGRDANTDYDGKGNLIRMNVEDMDAWVALSEYDIDGDWNIQARLVGDELNRIYFSIDGSGGALQAEADGEEIESGDGVEEGTDVLFTAIPDAGYELNEWILNGEVVEDHTGLTLEVTDVSSNIEVSVSFMGIHHLVNFEVAGNNGNLTAEVNGQEIQTGDEVQEGKDILFTAEPHEGYALKHWTLNGEVLEDELELTYVHQLEAEISLLVEFESTVGIAGLDKQTLLLYPNPAKIRLNIESGEVIENIRLLDINGNLIREIPMEGSTYTMDVGNLPPGLYLVSVLTKKGVINQRIQIVR